MFHRALRAIAFAGIGLLIATGAMADKPKLLRVTESVNIAATPDKVWDIIKNFGDMSWHPAVKSSSATTGNTVGSVRTLDLGGPKLIEALTAYDDKKETYTYKITDDPANVKTLPVTKYVSTISVKKASKGTSTVTWKGKFYRADPSATPATGQDDAAATAAATGVYRGGLDGLKKKAETPS